MRFYEVIISRPSDGYVFVPNYKGQPGFTPVPPGQGVVTWSTLNPGASVTTTGGTNPNAQQLTMDMPVTAQHLPGGDTMAFIKINGVDLLSINQAIKLQNMNISVSGGMAKGLPLANPAQAGTLTTGQVFKSFGTYVNLEQSISIYIIAGSSPSSNQTTANPNTASSLPIPTTNKKPANIVFVWKQGQKLMDAIVNALSTPFPQYPISGSISPNLVWSSGQDAVGVFATLPQLARWVQERSLSMLGGYAPDTTLYTGVSIALQKGQITVYDGTTPTTPKDIAYNDVIGQPVWVSPVECQVQVVMRSDIDVGNYVTLPDGPSIVTSNVGPSGVLNQGSTYTMQSTPFSASIQDQSTLRDGVLFQGTFVVVAVRHVGDSRQPSGDAWITALDLVNVGTPSEPIPKLPVVFNGGTFTFYKPQG